MRVPALVAVLFLALPLAGCLSTAPEPLPAGPGVAQVGAPAVDARATLDSLKAFSEAYPYRQSGQQTHLEARDDLEAQLAAAGLETMRQSFDSSFEASLLTYPGENILGIKWGADRERWVVVGAHYDITEGAVYGAYDDGSGTIMTVELAKAFADVPTNRTIAFILFDQEERGLVGSRFFVENALAGTFELPITVDAMIDLDMIGITWPHPAKLVCWENSPSLEAKVEELRKAVGVPDENIQYREPSGGTSDGAAFIAAGIPTAYFWSDWDEVVLSDGTVAPEGASYPFWHQADTYETMVAMAGDEATLEAGFQTVLDVVSPLLLYMASSEFVPDAEVPEE